MPASRIANFPYLHSVRPLVSSHYPPEYHSFMYSADMSKIPRSNRSVENYMFYDSSTNAWTCVMPIMLVTRTTIVDSAAVCLLGSGINNDGNYNHINGAMFNYVWFKPNSTSVTNASSTTITGLTAAATATATWTAGSKTVTLASVTGTPTKGQTLTLTSSPSASESVSRATPNGFGVVTYNAGGPSVTLSHAPTESGSGAVGFFDRRPLSDLYKVIYCNDDNVPYVVYGGGDFVSGGGVNEGGFSMAYPGYDTAASSDLLGPESFGGDPPYMDFPANGETWGSAASYTIVNNCCVVDRSGGGDRGQGKALGLMMTVGFGNISPAEVRDRLQAVRLLVTIRHRSSLTGGKGG